MVRVVVVNRHLLSGVGGSELQCDLVARGLVARGHEVVYVAAGLTEAEDSLPYRLLPSAERPAEIVGHVLAAEPDVVYWRYNRRGLREVASALRPARIPLVVALAHVDDVTRWPSWPWLPRGSSMRDRLSQLRSRLRWRRQFVAYRDVAAIASQRADLVGLVPRAWVPDQRHVPNMMDVTLERAAPFRHPRPYVAWVANLKARKRPDLLRGLADALARIDVDLLVVGAVQDVRYGWIAVPDPEHPNLHHLGALPTADAFAVMAAARCLVVTAKPEGFSNAMLQAWWAGTPTVTLDYDPDGLVRSEALGSVADGDVRRLHTEVVRFASDGPLAHEAGQRAQRFARARFAPEVVLDDLERLLLDTVAAGGAR